MFVNELFILSDTHTNTYKQKQSYTHTTPHTHTQTHTHIHIHTNTKLLTHIYKAHTLICQNSQTVVYLIGSAFLLSQTPAWKIVVWNIDHPLLLLLLTSLVYSLNSCVSRLAGDCRVGLFRRNLASLKKEGFKCVTSWLISNVPEINNNFLYCLGAEILLFKAKSSKLLLGIFSLLSYL